mgnify:CR=1 FL=1|tara:strand:- start:1181 stop:2518 length:1338 start_codon:yes stop_codon:yes gene_type:complete
MAAFEQFNTNEVVITPFYANKDFKFIGSEITASNVGIEYYQSKQGPYKSGSYSTGFGTRLDGVLVFSNIKQLYYSNYLTSSIGDNAATASLVLGANSSGNTFVGQTTGPNFDNFLQTSEVQDRRFAQYSSSANIDGPTVISIPSKLFGEKIPPSTFEFTFTSSAAVPIHSFVYDDGEGNLLATQSRSSNGVIVNEGLVGQIFYSQGIAVLTEEEGGLSNLGGSIQNTEGIPNQLLSNILISFSSSITIRENQYKCTVRDNEYSYTNNPSALRPQNQLSTISNQLFSSIINSTYPDNGNEGTYVLNYNNGIGGNLGTGATVTVTIDGGGRITNLTTLNPGSKYLVSDQIYIDMSQLNSGGSQIIPNATGIVLITLALKDIDNYSNLSDVGNSQNYYDFATGSYFSPYVTTIGLYNESYQLVAVGKLAQPIPISLYTDTTFVVNFDT